MIYKIHSFHFNFLLGITVLMFLDACVFLRKPTATLPQIINLDVINVNANLIKKYNPSVTRKNNLIHTKLEVKFDWEKRWLYGKATLTLSPYFYTTDTLELDAKGFDIHEISMLHGNSKKNLNYSYLPLDSEESEKKILSIYLDKKYTRMDTFYIFIDYTSKPNELTVKGSKAITAAKGLYFINPDGKEKDKPRQIWTQGETESNSCWFPTIDSPNERMTQEIYITVDTNFTTLSNGLLVYSINNGDGTRTDYWKQELPHAPYLAMMAIGEYVIVKELWRDIEVNYYVEPKDEKYALLNFGNTPEMLEFFSNKLGVDYPWEKYSQVVVRDFVSGAMENTSATLHGYFVLRNDREYLDRNHEDIVSHELFHHWFGNLVTCESWANIPLNESFGTYGEYLWEEYKYGSDAADYHIQTDLNRYLHPYTPKNVDVIRFDYHQREDMFDRNSYEKGCRILHMLRKYVGDDAFFESLKYYLTTNKFTSVEIHDLRLAFEKITGEDLKWFFDQWFLSSGHPQLIIKYKYHEKLKQQKVLIRQDQKLEYTPIYKLPLVIDIYVNGTKERHNVVIDSIEQTFIFYVDSKPDLVNFDAEKMLLCIKSDKKTSEELVFQYFNAPKYLDRYEAIEGLGTNKKDSSFSAKVIIDALNDKFWNLRVIAMQNLTNVIPTNKEIVKQKLMYLAQNDEIAAVRSNAIKYLSEYFTSQLVDSKGTTNYNIDNLTNLYRNAINDRAYSVIREGLLAMTKVDSGETMNIVNSFDEQTKGSILLALSEVFSIYGTNEHHDFFQNNFNKVGRYDKRSFWEFYLIYLLKQNDTTINKGLIFLDDVAKNDNSRNFRLSLTILDMINKIVALYNEREKNVIEKIKNNKKNSVVVKVLKEQFTVIKNQKEHVSAISDKIKGYMD